jgi:hypothetical protein
MTEPIQTSIVELLSDLACIPTSAGMRVPEETYFAKTDFFPDLPVVNLPSVTQIKGNLKELLTKLGVRKHVDIQTIFVR